MTRDYERRRLREIYDRNRRRVDTLAKTRDRNESGRNGKKDSRRDNGNDNKKNNGSAPRRYIVSERVTKRAGFGAGGRQGRTGGKIRHDGSRREERFADRKVTRRTHKDRFERAERNGSRNDRKNNGRNKNVVESRRSRDNGRGAKKGGDNKQSNNGGRRFSRVEDRKAQRKNNNNKSKSDNKKKPAHKKPFTADDLNAQLEAYKNNEVFNPTKAAQQANNKPAGATFESLDAQLEAYKQ